MLSLILPGIFLPLGVEANFQWDTVTLSNGRVKKKIHNWHLHYRWEGAVVGKAYF